MTSLPSTTSADSLATNHDRHRYPGVRPFQEADASCFFGRPKATEELLLRVLSVRLLLQFAPSGAGKTSLLNAGLLPRLRRHGYLPATVRLNRLEETLVDAVGRSLRDAAVRSGLDDPVIPARTTDVWDLLAGTQLWTRELLLLTPVLVFDQFEEVFTLRDHAFRRAFAQEIGALCRSRRAHAPAEPADASAPDVKIIISLREEYLGSLEEMTLDIPELFRERLRLSPLTNDEARDAIVEPARLAGDWLSPPFDFDEACLDGLIDFIDGVSERIHLIEPLTLQLVCQRAEAIVVARASSGERPTLTLADFGGPAGLEALVHHYYSGELDKLGDRATHRRAAAMFEDGLLDPSGKRLMLEQDEIRRQYGLDEAVLSSLVESRLLRREPRNESVFYEISHDRLTDVIARHRTARVPRWVWPALGAAGFLIVVLIASLFAMKQAQDARTTAARALNVLFGDELGRRLREAGLSDAFERTLTLTSVDEGTDPLARASHLRRRAELAGERDTLATTEALLTEALAITDGAMKNGDATAAMRAERAQILKVLGDARTYEGEITKAGAQYDQAVKLWRDVAEHDSDPTNVLNAIEAQTALAATWERLGDAARAEGAYARAAYRAAEVAKRAYHQVPEQGSDNGFLLGRAMEIYADAVLSLARVWWAPEDLKRARALSAELIRLRPLSAPARISLGTTSAMYGASLARGKDWPSAQWLLAESDRQFRELTQFDPKNRRMSRDMAAVRLNAAQAIATCAENPACRKALPPAELETAESSAITSIGIFQELAEVDSRNHALRDDVAWGKEVLAAVRHARGARAAALSVIDEALEIRRANLVDPHDVEARSQIVAQLLVKARNLNEGAQRPAALQVVDEALAAAEHIPSETGRRVWRSEGLQSKSAILKAMGHTPEAGAASDEADRLVKDVYARVQMRTDKALALNNEGNEIYAQAGRTDGLEKSRLYDVSAAKYRLALEETPADPVVWDNLRGACNAAAGPLDEAITERSSDAALKTRVENERRCALEGAWLAWLLSDDGTPSEERARRLETLYVDRRNLAMLLRNDSARVPEALALAEQGVREAEHLVADNPSPKTLFLVADSYRGLGMMREESHREGWEQAMRAAILRGEQLRDKEPRKVEYRVWLADGRAILAGSLDKWKRPGAAAERELARRDCQSGLRLAKSDADRALVRASCPDGAKH